MSHEAPEMVLLTSAANSIEAHLLSQALNDEGIHSKVLGDFLEAGIGNIPGVGAEIWVLASEVGRAEKIIEEHRAAAARKHAMQNPGGPHVPPG